MRKEKLIKDLKFCGVLVVTLFTLIILLCDSGILGIFMALGESISLAIIGVIGVILLLLLLLNYSPIGDFITAKTLNAKKYSHDIPRLNERYQEVLNAAAKKSSSLKRKKLYIKNSKIPYAFVVGSRNIYVTTGLVEMDSDSIKGVLAHELGHIYNKDTVICQLSNFACNIIVVVFKVLAAILNIFCWIYKCFVHIPFVGFVAKYIGKIFEYEYEAVNFVCMICIEEFTLFCQRRTKKQEFEADDFAAELMYSNELIEALSSLNNYFDLEGNEIESESHPVTSERIENLKNRKDNING